MKVLSIAVLALALYPGIDARDSPHHKEKGRVRVGQHEALQEHDGYSGEYSEEIQQDEEGYLESDSQEGYLESDSQEGYSDEAPRERGYAHVEEKGLIDYTSEVESRNKEVYFKMKSILCLQASSSFNSVSFAEIMAGIVLVGCTTISCFGAFCGPGGACVALGVSIAAGGKLVKEGKDEPMPEGIMRDYPDELDFYLNGHKFYKHIKMNTHDHHKIASGSQPTMKLGKGQTFCLKERDIWSDDDLGCATLTPEWFKGGGVLSLFNEEEGSFYSIEFELVEVTSTSPIVSVSKIRCKEVEDAGWWENDEVVLEVNGQSVWPENGKKYTISDGKVKRFNGGEMKKYGFSTSTNPKFCLYEYDGSKKDTKMGCHKFKGSDYKVNCDKNPGYKYRQTAHWRAGGGYYVVDFLIQCP